jgi:hypothetical protein
MRSTPNLPQWIRDFSHPGYTNVHSILPGCRRLYGTETLLGDWNAETLLLAKDAAPTHVIKALARKEGDDAWRHAERVRGDVAGWRTNQRVEELAEIIPGAKLYGSATANMLLDNPAWSRSLPGLRAGPLHQHLVHVLGWVIQSMPNLRVIACLGEESWYVVCSAFGDSKAARNHADYRDQGTPIQGRVGIKNVQAIPLFHPSARISKDRREANWRRVPELISSFVE